ncbi:MAG: efflux RND transporter permease subunit [Phycisphaerae bacterium]
MFITNAAVKNRVVIFVLMFAIIIFGLVSYLTLPRESRPDIPTPWVLVTTVYEGVSPEDIKDSVTIPLEQELASLKGLKEMTSTSSEGVSVVKLEFDPDIRVEDALQYVRDKVSQARGEIPAEAEEPIIKEINIADFPIMIVNVYGDISPVRMKTIADDLSDEFEAIGGVLSADVLGALEREIRVEIDADRVQAYGLSVQELLSLIPSENVNVSAGGLETEGTKFNVRVPAEFDDPEDALNLLLTVRDGRPIYLTDVATVSDTFKDRLTYSRLDGEPALTISIQKRVGANIVEVAEKIKRIIAVAEPQLPNGLELSLTFDESDDIRMMVRDLENNIISGLILVVLVLVLFLGPRTSLIVALAIPMSMLISFILILMLGYTLNMIVLFSLILALGMLVDNAIVIVENIYRYRSMGYSRVEAAMKGTGEVAWPVVTSTATTLAAFSPMIFWGGIMGEFMKYLPITLILTLTSSLFVALVINPTIASLIGGGAKKGPGWFRRTFGGVFAATDRVRGGGMGGYCGLLRTSQRNWFVTLPLAFMLLVSIAIFYGKRGAGLEFFPSIDPDRAVVSIRAPQGTNIERTNKVAEQIEKRIAKYDRHLKHLVSNVGSAGNAFESSSGPHIASLSLVFQDYEDRTRPSAEILSDLRDDLTDFAGVEVKVEEMNPGPPTGAPVTIRLIGKDMKVLADLEKTIRDEIASVSGLVNLRSDLEAEKPELVFLVDRARAGMLGVDTRAIGQFLKTAVFGTAVSTYRQFNDEYDIILRLPRRQREKIDDLLRLQVPTSQGSVPLSSLGRFDYAPGLGQINRVDQKQVVTISGDTEGRLGPEVLEDVQQRVARIQLPVNYRVEYAGEKEEQDKAASFLTKAGLAALALILIILVMQFNTLSIPLIIMNTVLLSLMGVLVGLLALDMPFSIIMTGIGVISLAGIVVNNAIVLLDYTRQLQNKGLDVIEASVEAGATRLRPVLLTATTTILGLVPMATGIAFDFHTMEWVTKSESSEWWRSMAVAVIFGLGFATVLTLVVVPTMYVPIYRFLHWLGWGGLEKPAGAHTHDKMALEDY